MSDVDSINQPHEVTWAAMNRLGYVMTVLLVTYVTRYVVRPHFSLVHLLEMGPKILDII